MKYVSTRDQGSTKVSFETAVLRGYAEDGGLFVPERLPDLDWQALRAYKHDYRGLAFEVVRPFIAVEELSDDELRRILTRCYAKFPDDIIKLGSVKDLYVLELFHGPTHCFKDLGLPFLVQLVAHFAKKRNEARTLLVATSGDTGPACVAATESLDSDQVRVFCCYPKGMVSKYQASQMQRSKNAMVASFDGGGDDMDAVLKRVGADTRLHASGVNSYNIARPLAQCVHFVWLALHIDTPALQLVIPTGAMGNLVAALLAKLVFKAAFSKILCACNANDFTYRALTKHDTTKSSFMLKTVSDAINIQIPYNFERLLYFAGGVRSARLMASIYSGQAVQIETVDIANALGLEATRIEDQRTLEAISYFSSADYIADPHTAVALAAAQDSSTDLPLVVLATAHACKFADVVLPVVGTEKWRAYLGDFSDPIPPTNHIHFSRTSPDEDLEQAQLRWEASLRKLLTDPSLWIV